MTPTMMTYEDLEVTLVVHEFGCFEDSRQRPKQQLLNDGFRLVNAAVAGGLLAIPSSPPIDFRENSFMYNKKPPVVLAVGTIPVIKDWGSSVSDDEIFTINGLEEFQTIGSTDIEAVRPKDMDIDDTSLHEIIPQPHLSPSPFLLTVPPPKGKPFNRNKPMFVAPYFDFSLQDDARVAWLIPIRGVFPWSDCTMALLFHTVMPSSVEDDLIRWNRTSLLQFWQFLLDLQKSGSLGALGVSFHTAKSPKANSDDRRKVAATNPADFLPSPMEYRRRCSTVDYIKIYHDASRSFYVRKAVDSWSYQSEHDGTKVRVLRGARFPLMDEISTTILIC